jgi:hypothetical protein
MTVPVGALYPSRPEIKKIRNPAVAAAAPVPAAHCFGLPCLLWCFLELAAPVIVLHRLAVSIEIR